MRQWALPSTSQFQHQGILAIWKGLQCGKKKGMCSLCPVMPHVPALRWTGTSWFPSLSRITSFPTGRGGVRIDTNLMSPFLRGLAASLLPVWLVRKCSSRWLCDHRMSLGLVGEHGRTLLKSKTWKDAGHCSQDDCYTWILLCVTPCFMVSGFSTHKTWYSGSFLSSTWHNLESAGKRDPQLKNCLYQIDLGMCLQGHSLSWLFIDRGGPSTLWATLSLGRWS